MSDLLNDASAVFARGGPVMWPLLAMSVLALALGFERVLYWARAHGRRTTKALRDARAIFAGGSRDVSPALAQRVGSLYVPCVDALTRLGAPGGGEGIEGVRRRAERFGGTLSVIITGAPLLGILGTVLGIIQSFGALGTVGQDVDLPVIAAGIAQALITTAFGLVVALIALLPYTLVRSQAQRALGEAEALVSSAGGRA